MSARGGHAEADDAGPATRNLRRMAVFAEKLMNPRDQDPMVAGELPGDSPQSSSRWRTATRRSDSLRRSRCREVGAGIDAAGRAAVFGFASWACGALVRRRRRRTIEDYGEGWRSPVHRRVTLVVTESQLRRRIALRRDNDRWGLDCASMGTRSLLLRATAGAAICHGPSPCLDGLSG
jgi:hypothetical protein